MDAPQAVLVCSNRKCGMDAHREMQETDGGDGVAIKPLSEQTLMNNYVFSMVMREPKRIKPLLEYILGKKVKYPAASYEASNLQRSRAAGYLTLAAFAKCASELARLAHCSRE